MSLDFRISQEYFKRHLHLYYYHRYLVPGEGWYVAIRRKSDNSLVAWSLSKDMDSFDHRELARWNARGLQYRKRGPRMR